MSRALAPILDHVRAEPSRTWSIIVTIYGDAIVPRGGSVWLGTLAAIFQRIGLSDGVVRTAMSRLASDGWLERTKAGRNAYYRLAGKGEETFRRATAQIYSRTAPPFAGHFEMILAEPAARPALEAAGFGSPAPGVWVAPGGTVPPDGLEGAVRLSAGGDAAANRALAARAWPLDATGAAYARFLDAFAPLRAALDAGQTLADLDCLVARVLMIHEYRRIVLRDPVLPAEILPQDWPGTAARALCAQVYGALLPGSERWLDQHAVDADGAPLPPGPEVWRRFAA
ncbi:phenylacetic acid degradation operon negative regulatory protein PaaX [Aquabacter spiritensis]|uniref:PaaX family transcriptional regulator n=1 Tax=Aquabacter spiritensis TaxID=933073 RepID=A0A4R3LUN1_9HYPH|nr:phenylacetic acid degradation operon negative regulatory protein PaaX [Aquabacter spiritensis]TCT04224.1 PaaX family transcriptional regulator [Aquabacter spiritensis]